MSHGSDRMHMTSVLDDPEATKAMLNEFSNQSRQENFKILYGASTGNTRYFPSYVVSKDRDMDKVVFRDNSDPQLFSGEKEIFIRSNMSTSQKTAVQKLMEEQFRRAHTRKQLDVPPPALDVTIVERQQAFQAEAEKTAVAKKEEIQLMEPQTEIEDEDPPQTYLDKAKEGTAKNAWYSWSDVMDEAEAREKEKILNSIDQVIESIRKGRASDDKRVILPQNIETVCPMLFQAFEYAAKRTGSELVFDSKINIMSHRSGILKGSMDQGDVPPNLKIAVGTLAQISKAMVALFTAEEYKQTQARLGLHWAAKQFLIELSIKNGKRLEKNAINALFGDEKILDSEIHNRIQLLMTDANSPKTIMNAATILLRRLARSALQSDDSPVAKRILWDLSKVVVRPVPQVTKSLYRTQSQKKADGTVATRTIEPKIFDECFFSNVERAAVEKINSLIPKSLENVNEFTFSDESPFEAYFERCKQKVEIEYTRSKTVSREFLDRKQAIRELALQKQKAKNADESSRKKVSTKELKIERSSYQEAYEEIKSKYNIDEIERETLRLIKATYLDASVRDSYPDLASLSQSLSVEDMDPWYRDDDY